MARLLGTSDEVALEDQRTRVKAPGMVGEATTGKVDLLTPTAQLLHQVVANSGFTASTHVLLTHHTMPQEPVRLTVPPPAPGNNAVLLVHDADGAASWHQPDVPTEAARAFAARAPGAEAPAGAEPRAASPNMSFSIPPERFAVPDDTDPSGAEAAVRHAVQALAGHFGFHPHLTGLHKVLSVLEYPIEHLVGNTGAEIFCRWEHNKHPYVLRWFPPAKGLSIGEPLTPTNWMELAAGRTLLLIHGIFSSCEGAFGSIDAATWTSLRERYGNRIIGFEHPTACEAPDGNAAWFLEQVPRGVHLDLDILCHSRGGLVARSLTKQADTQHVSVHNIVFAATPNGGTEITDPAKWSTLVNRVTSVLTLPARVLPGPVEAVAGVLAGVLEIVKIVAVGTAIELPGLEDMSIGSAFLQDLAHVGSTPEYYAIAAQFVPGSVLHTVFRELDDEGRAVDGAIFPHIANDIAVPTNGVWDPANPNGVTPSPAGAGVAGFPVPSENRQPLGPGDHYWHCTYFTDPDACAALLRWLQPAQH